MENNKTISDLFSELERDMSAEELMLSSLQALIAARITMRRHELGLSQKDFAQEMGVTQALVSRWESGETNFTLKTLVQIASKLDLEMNVPFKMEAPLVYTASPANIISFPQRSVWRTSSSPVVKPTYTTVSDELKEN